MQESDHGLPENKYNKHTWIAGSPEIADRVWIGAFCLIDALYAPIKIGRGTNVSSGAQILTHSTVKRCVSEGRYGEIDAATTTVGEFCFIGTNAVILMGVTLGHHSVVAAGAVVPENMKIPPYSIVGGVPAKIIGSSKKFLKGVETESISITVPAFNEEKNIEKVVKEAISHVSRLTADYEIVLVDDGSRDKTLSIIKTLARKNKRINVVVHKKNKGFTGAMKSCLYSATKHLVFLAPADGQFDFSQLGNFVEAIRGYDMAIGCRVNPDKSLYRRLSSWAIFNLYKTLFNVPIKEISTVFMWRRRVIESVTIESEDRSAMFLYEFFFKAINKKFRYVEVPVEWNERHAGRPKGRGVKTIVKTLEGMIKLRFKTL